MTLLVVSMNQIKYIFTFLCIVMLFSACERETQAERARREKILLVGNGGEPKSLDPHLVSGVIENKILTTLLEGLVADDEKNDTTFPPGAAESWTHNDDFTEWIFHLRKEAMWSDGVPVTADDFVFAYHRILHPELAAPYCEMLYFLKNAEEFNKGKLLDFSQVGVKADDAYTLRLSLREPVPYLPAVTRHYTWFPVPKHVVLRYGKMTDRFTRWCEPNNFVSNAAFILTEWKLHDHVTVKKNIRYWNAHSVQLEGVIFYPIENFYTETRAFLAGQLHTTTQVPPELVPKMQREYAEMLKQETYLGSRFVRCNVQRKGLNDTRVRQALSFAINRKQLCDTVWQGYQAADTFTPKMGDYQPEAVLTYDPQKARQLLKEAGYENGNNFPRYSLLMGSGGSRASAEALQEMWKKELNVFIDIRALDQGSYISAQQNIDYDLALAGWIGDYLDPTTFLLMWTKGNGNNNTDWHSDIYEQLLEKAAHQADQKTRLSTFVQAERLLMDEQPIIPIAWQTRSYLHQPYVTHWYPLLLDNHPWTKLKFE